MGASASLRNSANERRTADHPSRPQRHCCVQAHPDKGGGRVMEKTVLSEVGLLT